jgi:hypothetical protein
LSNPLHLGTIEVALGEKLDQLGGQVGHDGQLWQELARRQKLGQSKGLSTNLQKVPAVFALSPKMQNRGSGAAALLQEHRVRSFATSVKYWSIFCKAGRNRGNTKTVARKTCAMLFRRDAFLSYIAKQDETPGHNNCDAIFFERVRRFFCYPLGVAQCVSQTGPAPPKCANHVKNEPLPAKVKILSGVSSVKGGGSGAVPQASTQPGGVRKLGGLD